MSSGFDFKISTTSDSRTRISLGYKFSRKRLGTISSSEGVSEQTQGNFEQYAWLTGPLERENPLLPILLRTCRDLPSARSELRWLREHVRKGPFGYRSNENGVQARLRSLCVDRGRGKPLQYVLGTQPFGDLEIICKPGVLIPRLETEAYTTHLAQCITTVRSRHLGVALPKSAPLKILDLCTGSGCIALLLHSFLTSHFPKLRLLGIDAAHKAVTLAHENLRTNVEGGRLHPDAKRQVNFAKGDIFGEEAIPTERWEILIANPPYVSPTGFNRDTSLSVRKHEPKEALVPLGNTVGAASSNNIGVNDQEVGDAFYPRLLEISCQIRAKLVIMEVADMSQAKRVVLLALTHIAGAQCEIWRDWPDQAVVHQESFQLQGKSVKVIGRGNGRAVVIRTNVQEPLD